MDDSQLKNKGQPDPGRGDRTCCSRTHCIVFFLSKLTSTRPHFDEVFTKTLRKNQLVSSMRINLHTSCGSREKCCSGRDR